MMIRMSETKMKYFKMNKIKWIYKYRLVCTLLYLHALFHEPESRPVHFLLAVQKRSGAVVLGDIGKEHAQ